MSLYNNLIYPEGDTTVEELPYLQNMDDSLFSGANFGDTLSGIAGIGNMGIGGLLSYLQYKDNRATNKQYRRITDAEDRRRTRQRDILGSSISKAGEGIRTPLYKG